MLVVPSKPELRGVVHVDLTHLGLVVPIVRVRELDDFHIVGCHAVDPQHQLDSGVFLDAPPVVLDGVETLGQADLLPAQVLHPEDVVAGTHQHGAALVDLRCAQQARPADVGVDMDRRIEPPEADQVVEVVDVVGVPVVLRDGAEERVLHAELLELLAAPTELLVDVVGRHHRTVREPHLVPVQRNGCGDSFLHGHGISLLGIDSPHGRVRRTDDCYRLYTMVNPLRSMP